jgi:mannose-6-phosphate isomerase
MESYPYKFVPIYKEKIWGGRNLQRLFGRLLPPGESIGESWELADLVEGVSQVANGPAAGTTLTDLTSRLGPRLLGGSRPMPDGRFPLLLKLLDANDILSLQVHPDADAVQAIGGDAAAKTECWYVVESRDGMIYKGVLPGVTAEQFRGAIESGTVEQCVKTYGVAAGDFHYLPSGTVHALGAGVVVAEVQTPSDITCRVTDWGRGREIHVERSMQCIHFAEADDAAPGAQGDTLLAKGVRPLFPRINFSEADGAASGDAAPGDATPGADGDTLPGADGETLLVTEFFTVARRKSSAGRAAALPAGRCVAVMMLDAKTPAEVRHAGPAEPATKVRAGDTALVPACLKQPEIVTDSACTWLEVTLPDNR